MRKGQHRQWENQEALDRIFTWGKRPRKTFVFKMLRLATARGVDHFVISELFYDFTLVLDTCKLFIEVRMITMSLQKS